MDIKFNSAGHSQCGTTKVNFSEELQSRLETFVWSYEVIHRKSKWLQGVLHASGGCYCAAVVWKSVEKLLVKNTNIFTKKQVNTHTRQYVSLQWESILCISYTKLMWITPPLISKPKPVLLYLVNTSLNTRMNKARDYRCNFRRFFWI